MKNFSPTHFIEQINYSNGEHSFSITPMPIEMLEPFVNITKRSVDQKTVAVFKIKAKEKPPVMFIGKKGKRLYLVFPVNTLHILTRKFVHIFLNTK